MPRARPARAIDPGGVFIGAFISALVALAACSILAFAPALSAKQGVTLVSANGTGTSQTLNNSDDPSTNGPFFTSLGTNGRTCATCHVNAEGWSITPAGVQARFTATQGLDPIFRRNDGSNSPEAESSTVDARRRAYSMLLSKGLIRVGLPVPDQAEFKLLAVDDPYHHASAKDLSLFRRPLPSTNLRFLSAVMWDGREGRVDIGTADPASTLAKLVGELTQQAQDATLGHAQAMLPGLTVGQQNAIVQFELGLTSAQTTDLTVGRLNKAGGNGGAATLADESFHVGINDTLGQDPTGHPFNPVAFTLFSRWMSSSRTEAQRSVARGEALFNSKPIAITGVAGLNDDLGQATIQGSCTTCHNSPNVGNHSAPLPINIGVSDASRRTPDLPLYTLRNKATGQTVQTTDPGRALVTGKWADIGKVKGPVLRNLAARGPYFHNGSAATLGDVVDFYNTRFSIGLNAQERLDLVAFLRAL